MNPEIDTTTPCNRCGTPVGNGWSERWRDDARIEVVCLDCNKAEKRAHYANTDVLTSSLMLDGSIYGSRRDDGRCAPDHLLDRVVHEMAQISAACKSFERNVWFAGLQATVRAAKHRGFRAPFAVGSIKCLVLVRSSAGRVLFTFEPEDESYQVTLITSEDGAAPVMGIQGIHATKEQAVGLIDAACKALAGGRGFARDDKVGVV